jgi:hemerythrin-like domain-containing protein
MKRHPALQELSRDHHRFLIQARQIRWWAAGDPRAPVLAVVLSDFLQCWEQEVVAHFGVEEAMLFPFVGPVLSENSNGLVPRLLAEHEWLRGNVAALQAQLEQGVSPQELLGALGRRLHDHVRFEERVFFPRLQVLLTEGQLVELGERLRAVGAG